jgi:PAS domain S-box-containing protein
VPGPTDADVHPVTLRHVRPGRFAVAHLVVVPAALVAGVVSGHVTAALVVAVGGGLASHAAGQTLLRARAEAIERRYRHLVEEMPLSLYISALDEVCNALYVSPAIVDLLGYSLEEWRDNPRLFEDILHPNDAERVLRAVEASKDRGHPYDAEYRLIRKDGSIVWVQDRAVSVRDARGRRLHWQGFLVDVTARKEAEARFRTLVEQLPLITYIDSPHSADESATYVSPQIEPILGYPLSQWHADPSFFVDHLHPEDRDRVREQQRAARESGNPLELEYRFIAEGGRVVWLNDSYTVVRDEAGRPWYTQGFAVDITARKEAERDRETLLKQTQAQNERLRKLDRMKDEFIALVSHELRTPLTSIRGYLELLIDDPETLELPDLQRDWLRVIDRNAERLLRLVEDLLLTAQANAGALALEKAELDVAAVVEQAVEAGAPVAAARGISLTWSADSVVRVNGDRVRIGQVVDNLVSNALKFTPTGGRVEVLVASHGTLARIEVSDSGIGIAEDELAHLFDRFFRTARAQDEAIPGVGLGLSIAKAIVEAHGGRIAVSSREGGGTTFTVDLPATAAVPAERVSSAA